MTTHLHPRDIAAWSAAAPRYTSYPSVPQWRGGVGSDDLRAAIAALDEPVALYLHVPFCWQACWYCGCNMVVARRQGAGDRLVAALERQIEALPLPRRPMPLARLHLGGGTPTWLSPEQLARLLAAVDRRFADIRGAERSIEVHPGVTTEAHLDVLAAAGFRRLSIGVQSTEPKVLEAIGRVQTHGDLCRIAQGARDRGFTGVNVDLVYGLPHQTPDTMDATLDAITDLRPERIALYGYAHLPWMRPLQAKIDATALPGPEERVALFQRAADRLVAAGWAPIGLDHFALPHDELARAARAGTLSRDFMGHTDRVAPLIGLGPSAISEIGPLYAQQPADLGPWYRAVEGGDTLPVTRGHRLGADEVLRRRAIRELMSQLRLPRPFPEGADARLAPWVERGVVTVDDAGLEVPERARMLLRNVASCFDATLDAAPAAWRVDPERGAVATAG